MCRIITNCYYFFTGIADFSAVPVEIIFVAGGATVTTLDIGITNDDINEGEQYFALFMEVVSAANPERVNLRSGRFAALGRIIDDDRKDSNYYIIGTRKRLNMLISYVMSLHHISNS